MKHSYTLPPIPKARPKTKQQEAPGVDPDALELAKSQEGASHCEVAVYG